MALNIRNAETEELAATLAKLTGESKTQAVKRALEERLDRISRQGIGVERLVAKLNEIALHCAALPLIDDRSPEEMLYDERGLPK